MLQRSGGISRMASVPAQSIFQNESGKSAPPGKRQPMPMMASDSFILSFHLARTRDDEAICRAWQGVSRDCQENSKLVCDDSCAIGRHAMGCLRSRTRSGMRRMTNGLDFLIGAA